MRQTRRRLNKQPPIDGQVTRNWSSSLEADCEDNVKSAIRCQRDEQVVQVGGALHAVVAQWVHVAQSAVGIPSAQGRLRQSRQRHRKRARFVEGQNNLALLAVLVLEGEAYPASPPEIVDDLAADDILIQFSLQTPCRGRSAAKNFLLGIREIFQGLEFSSSADLVVDGEYVAARLVGSGTHAGVTFLISSSDYFRRSQDKRCISRERPRFGSRTARS